MSSLNSVSLIGNVGQAPEIKTLPNGGKVANLSVATSESYKNKSTGEKVDKTQWHRVTVWNEGIISVIEKYVAKGDKVFLQGKLETRKFTNKAGDDQYVTEVVLGPYDSKLVLLGSPKSGQAVASEPAAAASNAEPHDDGSEIPF